MHNFFSRNCHKYIALNDQCTRFLPLIGGLGALFTIQHSGRISHSCLYHLFKLLVAIGTMHSCYEANDRSVLAMPEKFSSHNKI